MTAAAVDRRRTAGAAAVVVLSAAALLIAAVPPALAADEAAARELTVAYAGRPSVAFDPLHAFTHTEAQLFTALSEGLVSYHPVTLAPVPGVAHTWRVSGDGLRYRFLLRDNARFSDGTRVVAEDFRASWMRVIDPGEQAEYSLMFDVIRGVADYRAGITGDQDQVGIRAISPGELEVVLERPAEHFLSMLAHHAFAPVYPAYRAQVGWERQAPIIGNGPFRLAEWQGGGSWSSSAIRTTGRGRRSTWTASASASSTTCAPSTPASWPATSTGPTTSSSRIRSGRSSSPTGCSAPPTSSSSRATRRTTTCACAARWRCWCPGRRCASPGQTGSRPARWYRGWPTTRR